jgi:hypothetical protein
MLTIYKVFLKNSPNVLVGLAVYLLMFFHNKLILNACNIYS